MIKYQRSLREWLRLIGLILLGLLAVGGILWMLLNPNKKATTPYESYDEQGYTVSVRFDANGGQFGDNVNTTSVVDTYNLQNLKAAEDGSVSLPLLSPDDEQRVDRFEAKRAKYVFAGWYTRDAEGNYTQWDFATGRVPLNINEQYTATKPVLTLYALWLPRFTVEYYNVDKPEEPLATVECLMGEEFTLPNWDKNGKMNRNDFPKETERRGYTYGTIYQEVDGTKVPVTGDAIVHPGSATATGEVENAVLKLYIDYIEGDWYHISTAEQLAKNADSTGNYVLMNDLDFTGELWPSNFSASTFNGRIEGNGYTIRNVTVVQDQTSGSPIAGLFGAVGNSAVIQDVTFENVTYRIEKGTLAVEPAFGLFAGTLYENATLTEVKVVKGKLQISSAAQMTMEGMESYVIGLLCGVGDAGVVPHDIVVEAVDENGNPTNKVRVTVDEDEYVTVKF